MYIQLVYLQVLTDSRERFLAEATANVIASRGEAGILQFDLLQQADDPTCYLLYEAYTNEQAAEEHRRTAHFKRWLDIGVPLLARERVRVIYNKIV